METKCNYLNLVAPFMDGELTGQKADFIRRHLEICQVCTEELKSLKIMDTTLRQLSNIEPSAGFETRLMQKVYEIDDKKKRRSFPGFFSFGLRPVMAAAAAVLIIGGIFVMHNRGKISSLPAEEIFIAQHLEFFINLEMIDHIDLLENWDAVKAFKEKS